MQARESLLKGDEAGTARSRQLIEETIVLDPKYAQAYMYMGATHIQDFLLGSGKSPKESLTQGIAWEQKALARDNSLAEAHARLGHLYTFVNRHDEAIAEAEKAMAMDPNFAAVHYMALPRPPFLREAGGSHTGVQEVDPPRALRARHLLR